MDWLMLQVVLLYTAVNFGPSQSQGSHDFQPTIHKVSMTKYFHRLQLEWDVNVDSTAHIPETVIFNIQVNETEKDRIVLNTNCSVPRSKLNQSLKWSWDPLVPLQCEPQVIRIRSLVLDKSFPHSGTWSDWSPWEAVTGLDPLDDNEDYIFPKEPIVKAGSNITFCCIANKTATIHKFRYSKTEIPGDPKHRKMFFYLQNASQDFPYVRCFFSGGLKATRLNVIELPKPKDFSCKTEEMKMLSCSWKTHERRDTFSEHSMCETELILSDVSNKNIYFKKPLKSEKNNKVVEDSYSIPIAEGPIPKLRLTAKNCFGENYADYPSDVTHSGTLTTGLLLGIIFLLLIICICILGISCIRNHNLFTIPHPDVSPFLKLNFGTMEICDVAPNKLEVIENHQPCSGKQSDLRTLIIENITYMDPAFCLNLQEQEAESKILKPPSTSYKALQDFFAVSPSSTSYKPLQDFFAVSPSSTSYKPLHDFFANERINPPPPQNQGNFGYTSEMDVPDSLAEQDALSSLVEDMQPATELETNPPTLMIMYTLETHKC